MKETKIEESTVTEVFEKSSAKQANEEETKKYIKTLDTHYVLEAAFGENEDRKTVSFPRQSFEKILKLMPEKKKYGVGYVIYCLTTEEIQTNEIRQKFIRQCERKVLKDVFFKPEIEPALKLSHPPTNTSIFATFDKYFKERENKKKISKQ